MRPMKSVLLYGVEVWADVLDKKLHRKRLAQRQRRDTLRVAFVYRTNGIPVTLLAKERNAIYKRKGGDLKGFLPIKNGKNGNSL